MCTDSDWVLVESGREGQDSEDDEEEDIAESLPSGWESRVV